MNYPEIYKMLRDRALADNGSGGLFNAGSSFKLSDWYTVMAPEAAASPFVVQSIASVTPREAFTLDNLQVTVRFTVYSAVQAGLDVPGAILRRIYGDATQSGSQTHGFHRWVPSLTSSYGWTATAFRHTGNFENSNEDFYGFGQEYDFFLSRQPA